MGLARIVLGACAVSTFAWMVMAVVALCGVHLALHPYVAFPAMGTALLLLRWRLGAFTRVLVVVVAALSAYRGSRALDRFRTEREQTRATVGANARCAGVGEVVASPILRGGQVVLIVEALELECDGLLGSRHRVRLIGAPQGLGRGDRVSFVAQLGPASLLRQLELGDPTPHAASLDVVASGSALDVQRIHQGFGWRHGVDMVRDWVRRRITATYAPKAEALGRALVLGESDLDPDDQLAFQRSGLSHLLAVSGTHLVFAVASLVSALRAILLRIIRIASRWEAERLVAPVGCVLALAYADFAGGSGSAWRAAWMLALMYLARAAGCRLCGLRALAYSLIVGVICDPLASYDISFLLSAAATSGLVLIGPVLKPPLARIHWKPARWLGEALATTVSAMIPCTPLLLLLSSDVTLIGLLANVFAGPIGEVGALPACLLHAISAPSIHLERGLAFLSSGALLSVAWIARTSSMIDWARVSLPPPTLEQFALLVVYLTALGSLAGTNGSSSARFESYADRTAQESVARSGGAGCAAPRWRGKVAVVLTCAAALGWFVLEWSARRAGTPKDVLRVTAADVGQGDSLLVDLPDGRLMLVDGGGAITGGPDPGSRVLLPVLRARRRHRIDIAVLTHPHPDHYGGLLSVVRELPVAEFWETGEGDACGGPEPSGVARGDSTPEGGGALGELRRTMRAKGTRIRMLPELCRAYAPGRSGSIQVLGPCPCPAASLEANNRSLVIKLVWGSRSVMLPGDAEELEEAALVERYGDGLRADLLKLGHHGSRTSTSTGWLLRVNPNAAIVSVGLRNRFGHPHSSTLLRLTAANIPLFRTDELGSVEWSTDGRSVALRTAGAM